MNQIHGGNLYFNNHYTMDKTINEKTLDKIEKMGIKYLLLCPVITSELASDSIKLSRYTLDDIERVTKLIKDKGFTYGVKFHINNSQGQNTFVSKSPKNTEEWFTKYFELVKQILERMFPNNIDMVCIVNEAPKLTRDESNRKYFENMKSELKSLYPHIKYSQSGVGGEYTGYKCPFWDVFDVLCENNYPGSTTYYDDKDCPTVREMETVIYENGFNFEKACCYYKQPIIVSEFGCLPYNGWFKHPASWGKSTANAVYNEDVQYNYYKAYLNCRMNYPFIGGLFMWSLTDSFGAQGRKAEQVFIEKWGDNNGTTNNK